jgi:hypothetical protein
MTGNPDPRDVSEADLSIADGRTTLGFIFDDGSMVTATDAEGNALGSFADRSAAHTAIIECRKATLRGDTRNG